MTSVKAPTLRPELPPLPARVAKLPIDGRGYPVPWFVEWVGGVPDFRIMDAHKFIRAMQERVCWTCGQALGGHLAFTVGPMCAVNRVSAEPPSHKECAIFAAQACPFLTRPHMRRREAGLPDEYTSPGGKMITRNPGVALVWVTKRYRTVPQKGKSPLFDMGDPVSVHAFAEGRPATPDEVRGSIVSGLPILVSEADREGRGARKALEHYVAVACTILHIPLIDLPVPHYG